MALGDPFYHGIIRSTIIAFGELFSNVRIERKSSAGTTTQVVAIPITYGPKEKWLRRITENADLQKNERVTVPRMSFEIVDYAYAPERKLAQNYRAIDNTSKVYTPAPYDVLISLYILTRTQEDALNIVEQILPYFTPSMEMTIKITTDPCMNSTFPLILDGVKMEDNWDSEFEDQRIIVNTLTFTAKINLYGPILDKSNEIIKRVIANVAQNTNMVGTDTYTAVVDPFEANETDEYVIIDDWVKNE